MEFKVEAKPKSAVAVTVTITPTEMTGYFEAATKQLAGQVNVPGFRKGKVPRFILENRLGQDSVVHQAMELAVQDGYYQAVKKHDLKPIGRPQTDLADHHHELEEKGLTFTATVPVLPEVKLGDYQSVKVKPVEPEFKESQVDEVLEQLQRSRANRAQADRAAKDGDQVEIDFVGMKDGKEVPGAKSQNHPLVIGEDQFIPGFAEELIGMKAGQVKKFKLKFPKDYHETSLAGQTVEFTVTMRQVKEVSLPKADDAFAKLFGAKDLAGLRARLTDNLKQEKQQQADRETQTEVVKAAVAKATVEVPDALVEDELTRMLGEFRAQVESQGLPYDKYLEHLKKTEEDIKEESRTQAADRVKTSLVLNQLQAVEGITVSNQDVAAELTDQKARAQSPEQAKQMETDEYRDYLRRILGNRKVIGRLVELTTKR